MSSVREELPEGPIPARGDAADALAHEIEVSKRRATTVGADVADDTAAVGMLGTVEDAFGLASARVDGGAFRVSDLRSDVFGTLFRTNVVGTMPRCREAVQRDRPAMGPHSPRCRMIVAGTPGGCPCVLSLLTVYIPPRDEHGDFMRIIAKRTLRTCWQKEPRAEQPLKSWYATAAKANWFSPADVKSACARASIVGPDRVVFDIGGNRYRLIVRFDYRHRIGFVRFVGTHADYNRIDASRSRRPLMDIMPIRSEADYDAALSVIDSLMDAAPDTPEGDRLDVLVTLVEAYEARRWPLEAPDPSR